MTPRAAALRRSLDIYWRDTARARRMDALHAGFLRQGALAFDIGAHLGDRTASFRRQGARVVAAEPQPQIFRALRWMFRRDAGVALLPVAVADAAGSARMHVNSANPTVSTLNEAFLAAAPHSPSWRGQVWDDGVEVAVTTLDALIARHGRPDFTKIDVEGHEPAVLAGLGTALPALSFEVTTLQREAGHACIDALARLGHYEFNISLGEDHAFRARHWLTPDKMHAALRALPDAFNSGDIYARRL